MRKHSLGPSLMALFLFFFTLTETATLCQKALQEFIFKPGVLETSGASQSELAFQGILLQQEALNRPDILPVYGSSEFSAESRFHPWPQFDGKPTGFVTYLIGRGGCQSLIHSLSLAAQGDTIQGKKIAIVISLQWFNPEGISEQYFEQNFSPLQTYRILYDQKLDPDLKQQILTRVTAFPTVLEKYPRLNQAVQLQLAPGTPKDYAQLRDWQEKAQYWQEQAKKLQIYLTGYLDMQVLTAYEARDIVNFVPLLNKETISRNASTPTDSAAATLNWAKLRDEAQKQGQGETRSNTFAIKDSYFTQYVRPDLEKRRWAYTGAKLYPSQEYADLQLLMKVLREKKAEPLFLIIPAHGLWYDYTGYPKAERRAYYQRIAALAKENGFKVADFSNQEYERYFLEDIMHLGWKGWVYVNEELNKFYHQGR